MTVLVFPLTKELFLCFTTIWAGGEGFLFCLFKFPKAFVFFVSFAVNKKRQITTENTKSAKKYF